MIYITELIQYTVYSVLSVYEEATINNINAISYVFTTILYKHSTQNKRLFKQQSLLWGHFHDVSCLTEINNVRNEALVENTDCRYKT